jgi:peptidoglycan/LPS O-acetylase OafA/YrhL
VILAVIVLGLATGLYGYGLGYDDLTIAGFGSALLLGVASLDLKLGSAGKRWRALGDMSYSLYLVHVPVQIAVLLVADLVFAGDRSFASSPMVLPLYVASFVALAHFAYRFYERPARRKLRRLLTPENKQ